ncbi:AAA+ superfamily predicted ATPase [Flavobacterium sp. 2755]|uniref:AAA family ATPase n=1 Tax=Flavobacterium sp. 2755 TaxID=2817765 RepID=UPI002855724E|nr:AAA family ATPase [Flavobacterium sp. 2755]MDR6760667.1 AAA+ superfamily predicted ATPase [Flavobacterium sp. 2755]
MKKNPISIIEDSFLSLKKYLELNINDNEAVFTASFIKKLHNETTNILEICDVLNQDRDFIVKINECKSNGFQGKLLKTEHFFLADFITLFKIEMKQNEKAQFVMAYYYDVLRNKHFADKDSSDVLNQLIYSNEFKESFQNIIQENTVIPAKEMKHQYFLLEQLNDTKQEEIIKKYKNFIEYAFDKKVTDIEKFKEFFGIKSNSEFEKNNAISEVLEDDTLEKVLQELNGLIGLDEVKKDIEELINLLEIQKKRSKEGLKNIEITLHTVFLGSPGTGKTTVARLLSRIFKHLGFLSKGQLYETDREGLIAGYVGQTATKVNNVVNSSIGGVLFIDEAYALTQNSLGNDYGSEAVNILLKRMEDNRKDLAVVAAGYTEPMKIFIESNPGLRSRFNRYFYFKDFTPNELYEIFESFCVKSDFIISIDAKEKLKDTFELLYRDKTESFGNARLVRNIFEKCVQNQANRIITLKELNSDTLKTLIDDDIPELKEIEYNFDS